MVFGMSLRGVVSAGEGCWCGRSRRTARTSPREWGRSVLIREALHVLNTPLVKFPVSTRLNPVCFLNCWAHFWTSAHLRRAVFPTTAASNSELISGAAFGATTSAAWHAQPSRHSRANVSAHQQFAGITWVMMNENGNWVAWASAKNEHAWWVTDASYGRVWGVLKETAGLGGDDTVAGWGGNGTITGWGVGTVGLVAETEIATKTKDVAVVPLSVSTAIPLAQSVGTLHLDFIVCILMLFVPPCLWPYGAHCWMCSASPQLVFLQAYGDVQLYSPGFLSALSVPNTSIQLYCDILGPPNHQAVLDVDALLCTTLNATDANVPELLRVLQHTRRAFGLSGHWTLLSRLDALLANSAPGLSIDGMRRIVLALSQSVEELVDNPVAHCAETVLHDVLTEVIAAIGSYTSGHEAQCALEIEGRAESVRYVVAIRDHAGHVRTVDMTGPQSTGGGWTVCGRWDRCESLTWAAARMLQCLAMFNPKEIKITDNSVNPLETLHRPNEDVVALASSLWYLTAMRTLRVRLSTAYVGTEMIDALSLLNLPTLTSIRVEGPPMDSWDGDYSVSNYRAWLDALRGLI
ncbi:hypothetical protein PENSPDRAFT_672243 [Peniophora sp. CONT]|nr:hypothetical protein PENSPDRAFT_672243 [Peniophora sp. CONT]